MTAHSYQIRQKPAQYSQAFWKLMLSFTVYLSRFSIFKIDLLRINDSTGLKNMSAI